MPLQQYHNCDLSFVDSSINTYALFRLFVRLGRIKIVFQLDKKFGMVILFHFFVN